MFGPACGRTGGGVFAVGEVAFCLGSLVVAGGLDGFVFSAAEATEGPLGLIGIAGSMRGGLRSGSELLGTTWLGCFAAMGSDFSSVHSVAASGVGPRSGTENFAGKERASGAVSLFEKVGAEKGFEMVVLLVSE